MLQTTIRPEWLPDIFHIVIPSNLCRAQLTWFLMGIFLMKEWLKKINKIISNSPLLQPAIGEYFKGFFFVLFVCLKHVLLLGSEYLSSAVADDRCHPAVLLWKQWLSETPKAKFPLSVLGGKKKSRIPKCEFTLQCFKGYTGNFCPAGSYWRTMQIQAFPWQ